MGDKSWKWDGDERCRRVQNPHSTFSEAVKDISIENGKFWPDRRKSGKACMKFGRWSFPTMLYDRAWIVHLFPASSESGKDGR